MKISKAINKIALLTLIFLFSMSFTLFAAEGGTRIPINPNDKAGITEAMTSAGKAVGNADSSSIVKVPTKNSKDKDAKEVELFKFNGSNELTFFEDNFKQARPKEVKKAMTAFIDSLKDSSISADTQQDIMNQIQESDSDVAAMMLPLIFDNTKADLFTAYKWLYPFMSVVRVVFGLGAVVLILIVIASTILDLAYIGLPMWRENSTEKSKGKKPFGVSLEALSTVMSVEKNLGEYQNAYLIYFKRRALTYIVLSIAILYLVAGELGGLISWVLQLVSGIVQ
jgi:hypothetical protein|nr:hypothetical protein [uncultured Lachnoclostridium sp.]